MTGLTVERVVLIVLVHAILVSLFVSLVLYLRSFRPEATGFEEKGLLLQLYHLCRVGLVCFLTIICYSAGYRAIELVGLTPYGLFNNALRTFILCFFFGASLYGIAFAVLGLLGLISLKTALVSTIPMLLICYHPLRALIAESHEGERHKILVDTHAGPLFVRFVMVMAGGAALMFLITRVVYIPVFDPNIWEHYVHYYRAVLASGSTQPNEVWHHFYASKGAGLILLANVLSDFFGAQLVSGCFVLVAGIIILDLLLEDCRSTSWAFWGVMLFFTFLYGWVSDGATFKHHGVLLGYASFTLWGSVWLQRATAVQFRPLVLVLVVSLSYLGFYLPGATATFAVAFLLVALTGVMLRSKPPMYPVVVLAGALCVGSALAFATNWILTGLAEVTPMRWLWAVADRARVEDVFGTGGVEYFLAVNNDLRREYDWSLRRMWKVLRYPLSSATMYWSLLAVTILLVRDRARGITVESDRSLMYLAAFTLPLSAFAQAVQTVAVDRMALYSIVFTTMASVILLKRLVDATMGVSILYEPIGRRSEEGNGGGAWIGLWRLASMVIIVWGMGAATQSAWKRIEKEQGPIIYQYVSGAISLKEAFQKVERRGRNPRIGIDIAAMSEFRKQVRADERILRLTYDAGFSYALPGRGVVSEPTYALIRNPKEVLSLKPREVAEYLEKRNIHYFAINLRANLFSTIAFTSLFDVGEMPRYLSVAYEDGDFFILTWRKPLQRSLPDYLLTLLEMKRSAVLHYPFTATFGERLTGNSNQVVEDVAGFERMRDEFLGDIDQAFRADMLPLVSLGTSRAVLDRILKAGKSAVIELDPFEAGPWEPRTRLRNILDANTDRGGMRFGKAVAERKLRARFVRIFRDAIYGEYVAELGSEVAGLALNCDERVPFARDYPADATC